MSPERRVGTAVALAIVVLLGAAFALGKIRVGVSGYVIKVQYKFLNDLKVDSPVKYAGGVVIGRVKEIAMDGELVTASLWIDRRYRVREDCQFWIFTTGMLGEMYVEIDASPSATAPFLPEGAVVRGIDPTSTDATLIRLGKIVDALTPLLGKEEVAASLHAMVVDLRRAAGNIAGVVDKHSVRVDQALVELEAFSKAVGRMGHDVEGLMNNMKTLADPANAQSVHVTIRRLNETLQGLDDAGRAARSIVNKIDSGKGALGALVNDERLASDIRALIRKLKDEPITVKLKLL